MNRKIVGILLTLAAVGLGICSWFMLPEVVAVQVSFDGNVTNTMPKLFAIAVPFVMTVAGSAMNASTKEPKDIRGLVFAVIGIAIQGINLLLNL